MYPPGAGTVLVRYGEVGIKSDQIRTRMEDQLQENIRAILDDRDLPGSVEQSYTRLYVHTAPARIDAVTDAVTDAFGVVSASPALRVDPTMAAICDALADAARDHYDGSTFAVRAKRAGPSSAHPFSSLELERDGGSVVHTAAQEEGYEPTVDLDDPEVTFSVECRQEDAYVFLERRDGPGGLPVGTQGPLVALVSGGIDSPVAAWLTMKRGAPVIPLYVDLGEYGGVDHRMRAIETVDSLRRFAPNFDCRLRVAPGGEGIEQVAGVTEMYRMLVARRFMFQIAAAVAEDVGAVGIVTGESIGQKSSQTATNLQVTSAAIEFPIHRPLLSMDKSEITDRAKQIGSYDDSTIDAGCQQLAPDAPATQPPLERIEAAEPDDLAALAADAAAAITVVNPDSSA